MDRPEREIPKEYREVVDELIDNQGWRYEASGKGHPKLYPSDKAFAQVSVPTTPSDVRSFRNSVAQVRRSGGIWPPGG
jgi:hypothetical protein